MGPVIFKRRLRWGNVTTVYKATFPCLIYEGGAFDLSGNDDITNEEFEAFRRFLALLPHGKDQLLVILKGHLLIEELLRRIVDERMKKPQALCSVRFECSHIVAIAEAMCAAETEDWIWGALRNLNKLRNDIAHELEPRGLKDRMDHVISLVHENSVFADHGFGTDDCLVQFEYSLWVLFAKPIALLKKPSAQVLSMVPKK